MPRCNSCNKMASVDEQDPEVNSLDIDDDGHVTAEVRIVNASACCGDEMTEANFSMEADLDEEFVAKHDAHSPGHNYSIEEDGSERTNPPDAKAKPGTPSRYTRTYYGAVVHATVTCSCKSGKEEDYTISLDLEDSVQASGMDSLS